jgi:hypothetical protein
MSDFQINEDFFLEARFDGAPQTPVQATVLHVASGQVDGPFTLSPVGGNTYRYTYTASRRGLHKWKVETADNSIKEDNFYVDPDSTSQ